MKMERNKATKLQPIIDSNKEYQLASVIADIKRIKDVGGAEKGNKIRRLVRDIK